MVYTILFYQSRDDDDEDAKKDLVADFKQFARQQVGSSGQNCNFNFSSF